MFRPQRWAAALGMWAAALMLLGCSGRKQVPFGLEDAEGTAEEEAPDTEAAPEYPTGAVFAPDQVEVPVGDKALVLGTGYALAALEVDLDGEEPQEALVISADPQEVRAQAARQSGLLVSATPIDSFLVPEHCQSPTAEIRQLSSSLVSARVDHQCESGKRSNFWVLTIEAQPRVRERITILPPNDASNAPIDVSLVVEDRDGDGYEDLVANVRIGDLEVPLAWLNRPGGFARDASQPEAALRLLADDAWGFIDSDRGGSEKRARQVIDAYVAMCRESGSARIGLGGTQGIQCRSSGATARAVAVAMTASIRRGYFIQALELQRWWSASTVEPTREERSLVQSAWQRAKVGARASWQLLDRESATAQLYFTDGNTLAVGGFAPRLIDVVTGEKRGATAGEMPPPVRNPDGRFVVRGVRLTCAGFEAEIGPLLGKRTHRVIIDRRPGTIPCRAPIDRPATVFEWAVLGWAPQGLLAAFGDRLRVIPLNELAKPAGGAVDLTPGSPLPAPIRGPRITPDGSRYVIPHAEGIVVRDWQADRAGRWLRPADWSAVPGELRSLAISPDGKRVAVQKGSEIRVLSW